MRGLALLRRTAYRQAHAAAGTNPNHPRFFLSQFDGSDAEALAAAAVPAACPILYTAAGAARFIFGVSEFDGPDVME